MERVDAGVGLVGVVRWGLGCVDAGVGLVVGVRWRLGGGYGGVWGVLM